MKTGIQNYFGDILILSSKFSYTKQSTWVLYKKVK
jgi:hypothetical protein